MFKCDKCEKSFKTKPALNGHQRVHSDNYNEIQKIHKDRIIKCTHENSDTLKNKYYDNPTICKYCASIVPYIKGILGKRPKLFCNKSCAASYTNKLRGPRSNETKKKISNALIKNEIRPPKPPKLKRLPNLTLYVNKCETCGIIVTHKKTYKKYCVKHKKINPRDQFNKFKENIEGEYTKLYLLKCAHCNKKFVNRQSKKYCMDHSHLYKNNNRNRYAFSFSLSKYPDLFGHASDLLTKVGMWRPTNKNGLTRDHKVSVNEAIRNNYDPFYIKHPINCELMTWHDNNKKNTDSSISYEELKKLVDAYEKNKQ